MKIKRLVPVLTVFLGLGIGFGGGQPVASNKGANWLEALVLKGSFREAEKLAADAPGRPRPRRADAGRLRPGRPQGGAHPGGRSPLQ